MPINPNMEAIETVTVGAGGQAAIEFNNIPQTYTDLLVKLSVRSSLSGVDHQVRINVNSTGVGSSFSLTQLQGNGASASSSTSTTGWITGGTMPGTSATANTFGSMELYIPNYTGSSNKSMSVDAVGENNATTTYAELNAVLYSNTAVISSLSFTGTSGNFVEHSTATLYGVTSAGYGAKATGGVISEDNQYYYHSFFASGTFTPTQSITADCLVVAGGGGATYGKSGTYYGAPGGGADVQTFSSQSLTATNYTVTIGAGGGGAGSALDVNGSNGNPSQFGALSAVTGGYGAVVTTGYGGTSGNGNLGGAPNGASTGGGGGAGAVGTNATGTGGGIGGNGATSSLINEFGIATGSGELVSGNYYFGGGGGGTASTSSEGLGGFGGAGDSKQAGTVNTGGAAGGGEYATYPGLGGGSGLVIVRYAK